MNKTIEIPSELDNDLIALTRELAKEGVSPDVSVQIIFGFLYGRMPELQKLPYVIAFSRSAIAFRNWVNVVPDTYTFPEVIE